MNQRMKKKFQKKEIKKEKHILYIMIQKHLQKTKIIKIYHTNYLWLYFMIIKQNNIRYVKL